VLRWRLGARGGLDPDELHSLLLGKLIAAGQAPDFYIGSVSRYEGGSWLIGWPVAAALRLGATDLLAGPLAAAAIATLGVALASWRLGRGDWRSAALLGPLLACTPDVLHWGVRAWGSLPEALLAWPLVALAHDRWKGDARGGLLLGVGVGLACVVSYLHLVTLAALLVWERKRGWPLAVGAAATLGLWLAVAVPFPEEAVAVRGGTPIWALLGLDLLRLDRVLLELPAAWSGGRLAVTPLRWAAGAALMALGAWAAVRSWREQPGPAPLLAGALGLALAGSHAMLGPPANVRYYLPLVVLLLGFVAAAGWRPALAAMVLSLGLWAGEGPVVPRPDPVAGWAQLGANGQHRYHDDPHRKIKALWSVARGPQRRWLLYGYGVDSGRRYSAVIRSMRAKAEQIGQPFAELAAHPHFRLLDVPRQVDWARPLPVADGRDAFAWGLGVGFAADGRLDAVEEELLGVAGELAAPMRAGYEAALRGPEGELGQLVAIPIGATPEPAQGG
jgi:hypothetical protein